MPDMTTGSLTVAGKAGECHPGLHGARKETPRQSVGDRAGRVARLILPGGHLMALGASAWDEERAQEGLSGEARRGWLTLLAGRGPAASLPISNATNYYNGGLAKTSRGRVVRGRCGARSGSKTRQGSSRRRMPASREAHCASDGRRCAVIEPLKRARPRQGACLLAWRTLDRHSPVQDVPELTACFFRLVVAGKRDAQRELLVIVPHDETGTGIC